MNVLHETAESCSCYACARTVFFYPLLMPFAQVVPSCTVIRQALAAVLKRLDAVEDAVADERNMHSQKQRDTEEADAISMLRRQDEDIAGLVAVRDHSNHTQLKNALNDSFPPLKPIH